MNTLIIGANSDVATALARQLASDKRSDLILASRDEENLVRIAKDIETRVAVKVVATVLDVTDFASHSPFIDSLPAMPDCVIYAAGYLGDQHSQQQDFSLAKQVIDVNYSGAVSLLERLAKKMVEHNIAGVIVGISSAAGERGRASNYIYGSAKAGLTNYLSGLRARLYANNIHVVTVIPGFMATKMTEKLNLPKRLTATPEQAAAAIVKAISKRKNILFIKPLWRYIMTIICLLPESIFKRTNL